MKTHLNSIRKINLLFVVLIFFVLHSCKDNSKSDTKVMPETTTKIETEATTPIVNDSIALNPAHGQPGHRCDIKVGMPLNSTSSSNNTQQSPLINVNSGSNAASGKLNPAHGQPGHQCGIKVGDPL